jgi:hypothetical protein
MTTMSASVIAAMVRRMLQVMPRLTHHNSAQLMMTGAMMSSEGKRLSKMDSSGRSHQSARFRRTIVKRRRAGATWP